MSDAETMSGRVIPDEPPRINKELFLAACRAKGADSDEARARLLGMPRRSVYRYLHSERDPRLTTAQWIAGQLGHTVDELWPAA